MQAARTFTVELPTAHPAGLNGGLHQKGHENVVCALFAGLVAVYR